MTESFFYDNRLEASADHPGLVELERVYALDFGRLSEDDSLALLELYRSLPGQYREVSGASWFGEPEGCPPYLSASAEPSGLQVSGILAPHDLAAWHAAFVLGLAASPFPLHDFD